MAAGVKPTEDMKLFSKIIGTQLFESILPCIASFSNPFKLALFQEMIHDDNPPLRTYRHYWLMQKIGDFSLLKTSEKRASDSLSTRPHKILRNCL